MTLNSQGLQDARILVREYDRERDLELVEKLERNCEIGSRGGFCILTDTMGDPLCRIRHYTVHIILVAELVGNGEVVGVVRGCIKYVGTGRELADVKIGCILGLRVSPKHRRIGTGLKLVKSVESWAIRNGACYLTLATDEDNTASTSLFIQKCNYVRLSSLVIFAQPLLPQLKKDTCQNIKIEKLTVEQATSFYQDRLQSHNLFPTDINVILGEKLNLGTWLSYFAEEKWGSLHSIEQYDDLATSPLTSWAILSIWKTCEAYKLQVIGAPHLRCFPAILRKMGSKVFSCFSSPSSCELLYRSFGFLFLYGLHGEGERVEELIKALWLFAHKLAENEKDCKMIVTEMGSCDPLRECIPLGTSTYQIDDLLLLKKVNHGINEDEGILQEMICPSSQFFVDPRDF